MRVDNDDIVISSYLGLVSLIKLRSSKGRFMGRNEQSILLALLAKDTSAVSLVAGGFGHCLRTHK